MALEVTSDAAICSKCGTKYSRRKGYFPVSYAVQHKGIGYIPVCKSCIDTMYNEYLAQCGNARDSVRQMCRKLDLYWSEKVYEMVARKNTTRSMMTQYIAKINTVTYAGKSYDDTLIEEESLWKFKPVVADSATSDDQSNNSNESQQEATETPQEIIDFWGSGYTDDMYTELEKRRKYWMSKYPEGYVLDVGAEAIIKQICSLELDIIRDRVAGKSVDKNVNALNNLLGSANLKPAQQKSEGDSNLEKTPFGVWIQKWETQEPIPEPDPELEDKDGLVKYMLTWVYGHLAKMLNIKNAHSKLYDKAIDDLRVEHPEYEDDEDDETFLYDVFESDEDDISDTHS